MSGLDIDSLADFEPRLGEVLLATSRLAPTDLARAQAAALRAGKRLDQAVVELGLLPEAELVALLGGEFGVETLGTGSEPTRIAWPETIPQRFWSAAKAVPLAVDDDCLSLGMVDPYDDFSARAVALKADVPVRRVRISPAQFAALIADALPEAGIPTPLFATETPTEARAGDVQLLREAATDAPVVRFVQDLIRDAVRRGASDIHLRPVRDGQGQVLLRLNGELLEISRTAAEMFPAIISRLKILANLDISERRRPQDGRLNANVGGKGVDVRLSTMPNVEGEGAVLRLLARDAAIETLSELGFSEAIQTGLERLFGAENGLILVTGPTGSGKTTTLHTALKRLIRPGINVVTIEDPVEYRVDGASQVQIDEKVGLSFPVVLRSLLRQDPDVILVGEIRDGETARIAVQAALTGHLVLATLHTNSAAAAIPRLIDMGVEPYLLAAVLRGVLSQRLLKRPCPACAVEAVQPPGMPLLPEPEIWIERGLGCDRCNGTGSVGRTAVGELLLLDAELTANLSKSSVGPDEAKAMLRRRGHVPMDEDLWRAGQAGLIAASEVWRAADG